MIFGAAIDQTIFYMMDNKVHSAPVLSRLIVENKHPDKFASNEDQKRLFLRFGNARESYSTTHGEISAELAFATKEELLASL